MGTANFDSMRNLKFDYPLVVWGVGEYEGVSPDDEDETNCVWWGIEERTEELKELMDRFNETLLFHSLYTAGGYYEGVQFAVSENHNLIDFEYTNKDTQYHFDMCLSEAKRRFKTERNKIRRWLLKTAKDEYLTVLTVFARFSNGETWYSDAGDKESDNAIVPNSTEKETMS